MKKILCIVSIIIIAVILYPMNHSTYIEPSLKISVSEARARRFGIIVDARTVKEREKLGYYPNSIMNIESLHIPKKTWILVYSGDIRAANMANDLYRMGYDNVRYISESYIKLLPGY